MHKILVCEDEHLVALDIKKHLQRFGYEVCGCYSSGEAALASISAVRPDLVLMDIHLQGEMDGIAAAKAFFDDLGIPVILITAYADEETVRRARESYPFGYIVKPFEEKELRISVELALYRHSADQRLHESEKRYRALFEDAPSSNFISTFDGALTDCNGGFARFFGFPNAAAAVGSSLLDRFAEREDGDRFLEHARTGKMSAAEEWSLVRKDGRSVYALATIAVAENAAGEAELRGFLIDMNERRDLEQQLRQAQKMEAVGRLAGGVAHDFNNVITAIMGYCNLLADDVGNDQTLRSEVDGILSAARKAVNLTRQLLAFSRKQTLEPHVVDANQILRDLEKMARRLVSENIAMKFFLDAKRSAVFIDPGQFEQVLINLIVNAKDALPNGGNIIIETDDLRSDGSGGACVLPEGDWIRISVRDNGEGISPENLQQIFEPFFTTKGPELGTGLGLSTAYAIVNQSGGRIDVESEPGKGSDFSVFLPLAITQPVPAPVRAPAVEAPRQHSGTVLLTEDDDYLRGLLARILSKLGYRVLEASNPGEAIILSEKEDGFLLISDIVMPHMSGYELANRLAERHKDLKVLFMSGYHDKKDNSPNPLYGKNAFIQKPFTQEQLSLVLSSLD